MAEREAIEAHDKRVNAWVKGIAAKEAKKTSPVPKTVPVPQKMDPFARKNPHKLLATKAAKKTGASKKPCHNWEICVV